MKQAFLRFRGTRGVVAFTPDSSRCLNCHSNLLGHDALNKPANGIGVLDRWTGAALEEGAAQQETETKDASGIHRSG
jgi:hypothetical protein